MRIVSRASTPLIGVVIGGMLGILGAILSTTTIQNAWFITAYDFLTSFPIVLITVLGVNQNIFDVLFIAGYYWLICKLSVYFYESLNKGKNLFLILWILNLIIIHSLSMMLAHIWAESVAVGIKSTFSPLFGGK